MTTCETLRLNTTPTITALANASKPTKQTSNTVSYPYSHGTHAGHCAPLLRRRPRDVVGIELSVVSDALSQIGQKRGLFVTSLVWYSLQPYSHSHVMQIDHCAPLLRQRPRDVVGVELSVVSDALSQIGQKRGIFVTSLV